ncbi:MAG: hypothetical protein Crog4KO_19150 [Crocinitomicaceae bacterium]
MRRATLVKAFEANGFSVSDQFGLLIIQSRRGERMYLRDRAIYNKQLLYICFMVHHDLFDDGDWKANYQAIVNNSKHQDMYTNEQVRAYFNAHYVPTYRSGGNDHFYNHRNRQTMAVPLPEDKPIFTEQDVVTVFGGKASKPDYIEVVRFKNFQTNKNQ